MTMETMNNSLPRERRSRTERLTVDLPAGTLAALKIHVALRETTIRDVITASSRTPSNLKENRHD